MDKRNKMETQVAETKINTTIPKPSILRQIVDLVDTFDQETQEKILGKIKLEEAVLSAKKFDEANKGNFIETSEEEIAEMVSQYRKKMYEESLSNR